MESAKLFEELPFPPLAAPLARSFDRGKMGTGVGRFAVFPWGRFRSNFIAWILSAIDGRLVVFDWLGSDFSLEALASSDTAAPLVPGISLSRDASFEPAKHLFTVIVPADWLRNLLKALLFF